MLYDWSNLHGWGSAKGIGCVCGLYIGLLVCVLAIQTARDRRWLPHAAANDSPPRWLVLEVMCGLFAIFAASIALAELTALWIATSLAWLDRWLDAHPLTLSVLLGATLALFVAVVGYALAYAIVIQFRTQALQAGVKPKPVEVAEL